MQQQIEHTITEIFDLYQKYGDEDYIGKSRNRTLITTSFIIP